MARPHPYPDSLCAHCRHEKSIVGARSTFVMCTSVVMANKYPRQPVLSCGAYERRQDDDDER